MHVLDDKQRSLLAEPGQHAKQQFKHPSLSRLVGRPATGLWLAQSRQQPGQFWPGRADQPTDGAGAEVTNQSPQPLHDRRIWQGAVADRHTASGQHAGPVGSAAGGQLGHQASLAHTGLAPHQDDGRLAVCRPSQGRLEDMKLLDTADKGRAHHAAAHLAGIIPRDRPEGNDRRTRSATKAREWVSASIWNLPDSGGSPHCHPEPASDDQCG